LTAAITAILPASAEETASGLLRAPRVGLRPYYGERTPTVPPVPQAVPPKSPARFNPDPGQWNHPAESERPKTAPVFTPPTAGPVPPVPIIPEPFAPTTGTPDALAPDFSLLFPSKPIPQRTQPAAPNFPPIPVSAVTGTSPLFGGQDVPQGLGLPRRHAYSPAVHDIAWAYPEYPMGRAGEGLPPGARGVPNRWALNFPHWQRYQDPSTETPYQYETPRLWHPYQQSRLKGDVPIIGEDIFLNIFAKNFTLFEARAIPTPSGVSSALPNGGEFFGRSPQWLINNDASLGFELSKGETAFKPPNWSLRFLGVYNRNYTWVKETNALDPDPRGPDFPDTKGPPDSKKIQSIPAVSDDLNPQNGKPAPFKSNVSPGDAFNFLAPELKPLGDAKALAKVDPETNDTDNTKKSKTKDRENDFANTRYTRRYRDFIAVQEAFAEIHLADLSNNYDFISSRTGIQPFVSDFRGFIYSDTNLGFRVFGSLDNNRVQYNAVLFDQLEKDTYSDLNTFDSRRQKVFIANVFKQDFIAKGYTAQFSFHANFDDGGVHYNKDDFITRPAPLGTLRTVDNGVTNHLQDDQVKAFYFGWTGDGHLGRLNVTHAFYQVFGEDKFNGLAGRRVDINAQMAALELSYDKDWIRYKLSGFYASGDSNPTDKEATGFDSIMDSPFFIGGPFSWYTHQGFNLAGTSVNLKQRDSLVPDMRTSKSEGQSNFVNPGVWILGAGIDADITPKLKGFLNCNYIWLDQTAPIETALMSNKIDNNLGLDASIGFKWRPLLTENIIVSAGVGFFFPGSGYKSIYRRNTDPVHGFGPQDDAGKVDSYLYNGFLTLTFIY
jgi:hypothetical protein